MKLFLIGLLNRLWLLRAKARLQLSVGAASRYKAWRFHAVGDNRISIGRNSLVYCRVSFDRSGACVRIGDRTFIGESQLVSADSIEIGDDVLVSWGVTVVDHNSHALAWDQRADDVLAWAQSKKDWTRVEMRPVRIGDRAWIGFNAIILKGVTVGHDAVVAAGAIVTKDVPPFAVVAGNPARVVRVLNNDR